jgi:hypothetical protein
MKAPERDVLIGRQIGEQFIDVVDVRARKVLERIATKCLGPLGIGSKEKGKLPSSAGKLMCDNIEQSPDAADRARVNLLAYETNVP